MDFDINSARCISGTSFALSPDVDQPQPQENTMDAAENASMTLAKMQQQAGEVFPNYLNFTKQISQFGPIDHKTQELIHVACSLMSQCEMCISLHVQGAAGLGATKEEILQAAMLAISMGGSPKLMYMKYVFEEVEDLFD
jgi:AhpD family alkylhydroperoxidase